MKSRLLGLLAATALSVVTGQTLQAQEILLGNLFAGAGPFATLAKTNEIAAQMAINVGASSSKDTAHQPMKAASTDRNARPEC